MHLPLKIKIIREGARVPTKGYGEEDAGFDLYAAESVAVLSGAHEDVATGIAIAPPPGYWARIVARSSTSRQYGLHVVEGIIDNGWRGELFVNVHNPGLHTRLIEAGQRVAQLIFHKIEHGVFEVVEDLPASLRGSRGFGSTGR